MLQEIGRQTQRDDASPLWGAVTVSRFAPTRLDPKGPPVADPRIDTREPDEPTRPSDRRLLPTLVVIFALLNAADLISTFVGLHIGLREGNPLMGALLARYGFIALILYKAVVVGAVAIGVRMLRAFRVSIANITIVICDLLVLFVVIANVTQYVIRP